MFNVPPETVNVPLLAKNLLLFVQPTVKSPEVTFNVPVDAIVKFEDTIPAVLTLTTVPLPIVTKSVQVGTVPLFQIEAVFQSPLAIEAKGISAELIPINNGAANKSA